MTEGELDPSRLEAIETWREKIRKYISCEVLGRVVGTYENDDDINEGKNG